MEIRNLITFMRAAEEKSFSRAASQLGYAQSTITMQIKQLEDELGVRLFDRIGKTVRITEKGEKLKVLAAVIIQAAADAGHIGDASTEVIDPLRIGLTESLQNHYMPDLIHRYHQTNINSPLLVKSGTIDDLASMLARNQLDLIFICNERLHSSNLVTVWERSEPVYFVASPQHPLAQKKSVTLSEILHCTFLQTENDSSYGLVLNRYLSEKGHRLFSYLDIGNPYVIVQLIKQNDGISFLPRYIIQSELDKGNLAILPYDTSEIKVWIQLFHYKDKFLTPAMHSFIDLIQDYFQEPAK